MAPTGRGAWAGASRPAHPRRERCHPPRLRLWYGWWLLFATTAAITLQSSVYVFGFGLFFVPIVAEFGWTRTMASGAVSLARLEGGLIGPLEGWLIDRWGPRRVMLVGIPLFALGWLALSRVDSVFAYYLVYVLLLSLGNSLGFFTPCSAAVANWFVRRRGFALGLMSSGIGFGTLLLPGVALLITSFGWRTACVVIAGVVLALGVPLATMVRHRPEPYGYLPDGAIRAATVDDREPSTTPRDALRSAAFWILAFSFGIRIMTTTAVSLHFIPLVTDIGIAPETAALLTSALGMSSVAGRLGLGWLGDRWGQKPAYALGLISVLLSFIVLANARSIEMVALFIVLYGPSYGGLASLMLSLRADYFGRRSFATIGGLMAPVITLGTLAGPILAGLAFDTTGSYGIALYGFAGLMLVALVLLARLKPSQNRDTLATASP